MDLTQSLLLIAALIAASAFFSLAEISLAASRRLRLRQMADGGDMRRALMTGFGNARLDQRGQLSVDDLPKTGAAKGKIGFVQ